MTAQQPRPWCPQQSERDGMQHRHIIPATVTGGESPSPHRTGLSTAPQTGRLPLPLICQPEGRTSLPFHPPFQTVPWGDHAFPGPTVWDRNAGGLRRNAAPASCSRWPPSDQTGLGVSSEPRKMQQAPRMHCAHLHHPVVPQIGKVEPRTCNSAP